MLAVSSNISIRQDQIETVLVHQLIREVRHRSLAAEAPHLLTAILEAAQHILANSKQSAVPHMTWEEWLHHAGLPQQQPAASSTHGEPTHQTTELLSIPPLDPDELRERTAPTPPKTPTDAWPPVPANAGDAHLYGNAAQLKRRGWTDKLINDLLGAPDRTEPHPTRYTTAPPECDCTNDSASKPPSSTLRSSNTSINPLTADAPPPKCHNTAATTPSDGPPKPRSTGSAPPNRLTNSAPHPA